MKTEHTIETSLAITTLACNRTKERHQMPHILEVPEWLECAKELLGKYWGKTDAFHSEFRETALPGGSTRIELDQGEAYESACEVLAAWESFRKDIPKNQPSRFKDLWIHILFVDRIQRHIDQDIKEDWDEFSALITMAEQGYRFIDETTHHRDGTMSKRRLSAKEAIEYWEKDSHHRIRKLIGDGASESEVQELINSLEGNQSGLSRFAKDYRKDFERLGEITSAIEEMVLRGKPPEIRIEDYFPGEWQSRFRILKDGLKFPDIAIVLVIITTVAAMLPPKIKIKGWSMSEIPLLWLFLIGQSGTAKSVLLKLLVTDAMAEPIAHIETLDRIDNELRQQTQNEPGVERLPQLRRRNLIYTAPTTQGIRADMAQHGEEIPGLLVRDELNGWLEQMANPLNNAGDTEFWLSGYDAVYSNDVFADASKSRQVKKGKLGVIGGIQPRVFSEQMSRGNANGFNSRPLFVHLPRTKRILLNSDDQTEMLSQELGRIYLRALQDESVRYELSPDASNLFKQLYDELEERSIEAGSEEVEALWAKAPGQVLRTAAAVQFVLNATGMEPQQSKQIPWQQPEKTITLVGTKAVQLAANLVMAGKVVGVQLQERSANPMLVKADTIVEYVRKRQGKATTAGVSLAAIRKGAFSGSNRPTLSEIKQIAVMLCSRGQVQIVDGGKAIRVV